jgi:NAD(P) transhydrogenase subunit alpha
MDFILLFTIFILALTTGAEIITKVPPTLHTPLMSGTNAISGITLIGALVSTRIGSPALGTILAVTAIILATINVVGGFLVTQRILNMFRRKD